MQVSLTSVEESRYLKIREILMPFLETEGYECPLNAGLIFSKARSDDLKLTKSFSCNALIKLYYLNKPAIPFKDFVSKMQ